jgi:hypothetical protein
MPRLVCFYGDGSAEPWNIMRSLGSIAELAVVIRPDDDRSRPAGQIFETLDVPVFDTPEDARAALGEVDGVVTYSEPCVIPAAAVAERWGLPGISDRTAQSLRSKVVQRTRLAETRCDDVPFRPARTADEVRSAAQRLGLPVVVKPDRGWGSRDARRARTAAEVEAVAATINPDEPGGYIVERLLQGRDEAPWGDYVSVEVVMSAGEPVVLAVTGKLPLQPPFREPGQFWPSHLSAAERSEICEFALRAVRALEVNVGALHIELKLCADGPHLIEVNGRIGGFVPELLGAGAGIDLLALTARAALGERLPTALDERTAAPGGGVRVQHSCLAPLDAVEFVAAPTATALGRRDDVDFYRVLVPRKAELRRGVATQELDLIQAVAEDHTALGPLLDRLQREIRLTLRFADGTVGSLTGHDIAARNRQREFV